MFAEILSDDVTPKHVERLAGNALRRMAADPRMREHFVLSAELRSALAVPASRYILGSSAEEIRPKLSTLCERGYRLGVEYVGEEISDPVEIDRVVEEYLHFLSFSQNDRYSNEMQIGFDLSNVGLLLDRQLTVENTRLLASAAAKQNVSLMISMERSNFTDAILSVFRELAPEYPNLGITIQAQLHRSRADLESLLSYRRKIRLVKGVYSELPEVALQRGPELSERYIQMADGLATSGVPFAVASHDADVIGQLRLRGVLQAATELEMLHGCNPQLMRDMKALGFPCRISAVYGDEFFLHFLHRLAEHTPNIIEAIADYGDPSRIVFAQQY